jgi:hypothetical protein
LTPGSRRLRDLVIDPAWVGANWDYVAKHPYANLPLYDFKERDGGMALV